MHAFGHSTSASASPRKDRRASPPRRELPIARHRSTSLCRSEGAPPVRRARRPLLRSGFAVERNPPRSRAGTIAWESLDDASLIAALADATIAGSVAIGAEIGRRRLAEAVPALEAFCRRFLGFGLDRIFPEQAAALDALAAIGGREAAESVARLIAQGVMQGPGLKKAVAAAAGLGANLPPETVLRLLRTDEPGIRADACRCAVRRSSPEIVEALVALLEDRHAGVRAAAALALGRLGRSEALPVLVELLRREPSAEIIDALVPIADEDCVILLNRLARTNGDLRAAVLDALDAIEHPRAEALAAALRTGA